MTLDDFLSKLIKGKKKKPLQNLKIMEYILQFPGLYAASCVTILFPVPGKQNCTKYGDCGISVIF